MEYKMSDIKKRRVHSAELKAKVAIEALKEQKTINELGQEYGVHPKMVGQWKQELEGQARALFNTKRGVKAVHEDSKTMENLYSEIGKLKMSLDWLKKVRHEVA
jgi:transposase